MGYLNKSCIIDNKLPNKSILSEISLSEDFLELFQNDILENHEVCIKLPDNNFLYLLLFACINRNEGYIDLMTVDVTKQKESDMFYDEKSDFLALLNHEIRTPLSTIIGFSELLATKINDDKCKKYIQEIEMASKNLLILINDMLDFSKLESGESNIKMRR
jgi:signal transduction histidine kinase